MYCTFIYSWKCKIINLNRNACLWVQKVRQECPENITKINTQKLLSLVYFYTTQTLLNLSDKSLVPVLKKWQENAWRIGKWICKGFLTCVNFCFSNSKYITYTKYPLNVNGLMENTFLYHNFYCFVLSSGTLDKDTYNV